MIPTARPSETIFIKLEGRREIIPTMHVLIGGNEVLGHGEVLNCCRIFIGVEAIGGMKRRSSLLKYGCDAKGFLNT